MTRPETTTGTATGAGAGLLLTERVAAEPEAVFPFLVDPEKMLRWMGTEADLDPRPGGGFRVNVNGSDIASGTYVEVDPPNRVVFTWGWEGSSDVPPGSSTVTITLTPAGDETVIELRHVGLSGDWPTAHEAGWNHFISRLLVVVAGGDPGPDLRFETD